MIVESNSHENFTGKKENNTSKESDSNITISIINDSRAKSEYLENFTKQIPLKTKKEGTKAFYKIEYYDHSKNNSDREDNLVFRFFVNSLKCYVGRARSGKKSEPKINVIKLTTHIKLFPSRHISRRHLKIFWDELTSEWMIENLSKNMLYVGKKLLNKGDLPIKLDKITPISGAAFKFYFIQAANSN
jgi:hypothetical protein